MSSNFPPSFYHTKQTHFLRRKVTYEDAGVAVKVGTLPNGAILLSDELAQGAFVETAFNGSGTDLLDVGFSAYNDSSGNAVTADPNAFATALVISATGWKPLDETAASERIVDADDKGLPVTATYTDASGDASAGVAHVIIEFIPPNTGE